MSECPECDSTNVKMTQRARTGSFISQYLECRVCGWKWSE